ncbi:hypothetical protein LPJ78_002385 [Coemansia sp. RSA 989]|nr:hypothetical protein LPJ68_001929 [Coemansia sp. RSA 1086]KAJ1752783.1 hypothetical protein LPJ79_000919 [Coemansia sp. RSA 1821]KAJ1865792.1 hypothetical protein LPJ78_002385 [Coemansia sp. RSA 989]KAJ1875196.1 hypothetical protein LPJ55_000868 [Coemansia sp. RSA 990]KAJ2671874.1 hypothetical protein IWW42_003136 [Coemansia sp. RSA 1085]
MKLISATALAAALACSVLASSPSTEGLQDTECVSSSSSNLFKTKMEVKHAKLFSIDYHDTYKVLNNLSTNNTYVLYQCGTDKPAVDNVDAFIPVPVSSAAAWSTSTAMFIEALGMQDRIKNLGTAPSIVSACLQELLEDVIKPFDEGNSTSVDHQEQNNTVVFNMPYDEDADTTNTVISTEYLEPSALGRSEWIKFFAAFFNAEERANDVFGSIDSNYECFTKKANEEYNDLRPVVAWTSYAPPSEYNNNTAYWQISFADYKYDLVRDAGARMLNTTGAQATTFDSAEAFLDALEDVDIVIDESFVTYSYDELLEHYGVRDRSKSSYSWVTAGRVFRPDRLQSVAGGLDWFEAPIAFADALLQDLIGAVHPKFVKDGYQPIWFRDLAENDPIVVVSASNCTDMYAARKDPAETCSALSFQEANPDDSDYEGVDENQTEDLIYDISKSEVINDEDTTSNAVASTANIVALAAISVVSILVF